MENGRRKIGETSTDLLFKNLQFDTNWMTGYGLAFSKPNNILNRQLLLLILSHQAQLLCLNIYIIDIFPIPF